MNQLRIFLKLKAGELRRIRLGKALRAVRGVVVMIVPLAVLCWCAVARWVGKDWKLAGEIAKEER